jgi:hypothetical protein
MGLPAFFGQAEVYFEARTDTHLMRCFQLSVERRNQIEMAPTALRNGTGRQLNTSRTTW